MHRALSFADHGGVPSALAPIPWHQFVPARRGSIARDLRNDVGDIDLGLDTV